MSVNANAAVVTKATLAAVGLMPPSCAKSNVKEQPGMFLRIRARLRHQPRFC
ncbi:MAG TPA: hypothetical protein VND66_10305 [Acidobacteriaceae bacterium]|nr:hypothetical protein [Acidobacteriaceae bacterium]